MSESVLRASYVKVKVKYEEEFPLYRLPADATSVTGWRWLATKNTPII